MFVKERITPKKEKEAKFGKGKIPFVPWGIIDCLWVFGLIAIVNHFFRETLAELFVFTFPQVNFSILHLFAGVFIPNAVIFLSLSWLFWFRYHLSWHCLGIKVQIKAILKGITAGTALGIVALASFYLASIFKNEVELQEFSKFQIVAQNWQETFFLFFFIVFFSPLWEEIYFRGFFYPVLQKPVGWKMAVLLTGFTFALLHCNLIFFLPLFVNGCGLTWLYARSNSLVSVYVAHTVWNLLVFFDKGNEFLLFVQ